MGTDSYLEPKRRRRDDGEILEIRKHAYENFVMGFTLDELLRRFNYHYVKGLLSGLLLEEDPLGERDVPFENTIDWEEWNWAEE